MFFMTLINSLQVHFVKKGILLFTLLVSTFSFSQLTSHSVIISGKYSRGTVLNSTYSNYALQMEVPVHENIGLNYNFELLFRKDQIRHVYFPAGLIGGPVLFLAGLSASSSDSTQGGLLKTLGILGTILPDGVSFHIPLGESWDISPYANIGGLEFVKDRNSNEKNIKWATSFGTKLTYIIDDQITISCFAEARKAFRSPSMLGGGIGLGVLLGDK